MTELEVEAIPRQKKTHRAQDPLFISKAREKQGTVLNYKYQNVKNIELQDPEASNKYLRIDDMIDVMELDKFVRECDEKNAKAIPNIKPKISLDVILQEET